MGRESVGERRRLPRLYAPRDLESEVFPKGIEISGTRQGAMTGTGAVFVARA
jgi:hypothetical protein